MGGNSTLIATVEPANASNTAVSWSSSDPSVAMVDHNGAVTANSVGMAIITVTTEDGSFAAACTVTVSEAAPVTTYTVTFDLNGGTRTGGGQLTQTVVHGGSATAPTVARSGYTFIGWNQAFDKVTSNLTVTAAWSQQQRLGRYRRQIRPRQQHTFHASGSQDHHRQKAGAAHHGNHESDRCR